ncbi:MAG: tRNA (guanosine(37)-N1)-methyltransferase TrmD [Candidatus Kerfeldbacteria bacterium RIFCSPHIGHO2_02_FULL_42_14]|uniref:tRNA (guanine-N(1)-)-methyltransferase n=1 Tax=Candidatus Kerfeldbacteria bacterium RIFCSPHIGHO2_02_FULL_42_14 TaxID=1798540 RepID=A0A1G2ASX1_9BACT|nr:MAG: tRNA (guanosine(37)-N1)-methyltransferase TrmD [Candidatus Kerfeldbacteria bacterium RIFCSPHIGHO2_02_FULL_42_14]OGY81383.1 MAG: tRNA (guanosine(37)-N1)-methyltransferase TrmD [Candidatus Kerfeldbacteria bacterium RIFCSPHIGHO2_12_FULL_42_13]OGY83229.1 MAG: tRNA (guanosine(37)-N1)-methyltransferase TrmD [Candidatus Kerfeldbacteria bacterium RIFCSPLOWO2_02_FULL_42_19]OGY85534.1 MAG: tRNA (guanosine(37)-N1)-methyltransferase TrmD [Candidatus Kerfeldbacteria bacterium RIFCSPLOWO2_12_FULL_43_9
MPTFKRFDLLTIFPNIFDSYLDESIMKRAQAKKLVRFYVHNIRDFAFDKHKIVDDTPYGGGPGMVMKVEPIACALRAVPRKKSSRVILLSARGKIFTQKKAQTLSKYHQLILICGHYEGVDERVVKFVDEEISIGHYVLTGGELPALIILDAVTRLIPGVLGKNESTQDESFSEEGFLEYPQYTRPAVWENLKVPKVLLSGDHKKIATWRAAKRKRIVG